MISKQQFDMCVNALNNGGAFITHQGYYGIRTSAQSGVRQINSEVFSAVVKYCGGRDSFQVTDKRTQFGIESTWELIDPVYAGELPEFARTDVDSKLTKTLEFKQKVSDVKKAIKNAFGCNPYERKNSAKYTLLKFWADSEVDMSKLENVISMFSDVSAKQLTRREFNVTIYPDTEPEFEFSDDLMEALNKAGELDEGTFSRVINKVRRATLDEHDPNNRKLYNFVDRFKKEFGIKAETKNAGYGYLRGDGDSEVRNYRMYLNCDSEVTKQFFIDGKAYKGLKPEYASRFTMNGASNYKPNHDMSDGEIQVEIGLDRIYFDLHVVMDATKAERSREKYNKRFAKAYELDDNM